MKHGELCPGDLVEVRGPWEILATLDESGALAGLPFMPEMVVYCGRRFTVDRLADEICDTVEYAGSRRVPNAVLLEDMRCDGSGHGGYQAECRFFWKEAWLRKVAPEAPPTPPSPPSEARALFERASRNTYSRVEKDGKVETRHRCQNTRIPQSPAEGTESGHGTVTRNAFHLVLGQAITTALAIIFSAALGRTLGVDDFGVYFLIASFATFVYLLVDWGQQYYVIREVARQPERGSLLLGSALVLRTAGAVLVAVPAGQAAWALGYDAITCWYSVVFIVVSLPLFLAQTYGMVFRARDRMGLDAWVSVANKIALLALALAALALGRGLPGVLAAQALAGFLALAIAHLLYRRMTMGPLRYSSQTASEVLIGGSAFFTFSAASNVQPYIDVLILSKLAPVDLVGWYGASKNILGALVSPALILGAASFPHLSRTANGGQFKAEVRAALRPILWLGTLAAIGTFLFADDAIAIVYGQHFGPSGIILKVYAPGFFLLFINVLLATALLARGRAKAFSVAKWASVVVSTVLELLLIPFFQERTGNGGIGVVAAFVSGELVVFGGGIFLLRRAILGMDISVNMARALGAAALTLLLFWLMRPLPFL
jgi:O-antigen/teichoic acid export membrane protein